MKLIPYLAVSAVLTGSGFAQTIVQAPTLSVFTAGGSKLATFNKFDTLSGTRALTGVTVSYSFDVNGGTFAADNDADVISDITFAYNVSGKLSSSLGAGSVGSAATSVFAENSFTINGIPANDGDSVMSFNNTGDDYVEYLPTSLTGVGSTADLNSSLWALYTGTGTFDITLLTTQFFSVIGTGGGTASQTTSSSITPTISVTYTYDLIPEPSIALLGGVGMLGMLRRRRIA